MATAKVAISSILDTVSQTAGSVSALINTTTKGVGMLDALVTKVSKEQKLRYRADAEDFVQNLVRERSEARAVADIQVLEFCNRSPQHKELYAKAFDRFSEIFAEELGTKTSE